MNNKYEDEYGYTVLAPNYKNAVKKLFPNEKIAEIKINEEESCAEISFANGSTEIITEEHPSLYLVKYNGKEYKVKAFDSMEAVEKVGNRMVFGRPLFPMQWVMNMYDADTRGKEWCIGEVRGTEYGGFRTVEAEIAEDIKE